MSNLFYHFYFLNMLNIDVSEIGFSTEVHKNHAQGTMC